MAGLRDQVSMNRQQRRAGARERSGRAAGGPVGPIAQWFNAALAHHHAGRIAEAERVCRQILVIDPDHAQNLHLLGLTEGVVYRCRRLEYPLVELDTNSS